MYTILIVDDERPAQTFIKAICQKYCPAFDTILLSGSADDALRLMAQQHVHVLVTDISMPGINGIELAARPAAVSADAYSDCLRLRGI